MGFINSLFGDLGANLWSVAAALAIVVVLIVFLVWLLKFVLNASRTVARGRNRRIGITESVMVDTKRQLLLIRRDDVEHLVLTGGPQDLIVEADIPLVTGEPLAVPARRPPPALGGDTHAEPQLPPQATGEPPIAAVPRPSFAAASSARPIANPELGRPGPSDRVAGLGPLADEPEPRLSPMQKLRQIGQRPNARGVAALRYPGLLRPITRHRGIEPQPTNKSSPTEPDSGMDSAHATEAGEAGPGDGQQDEAAGFDDAGTHTKSQG